MQTVLVVGGGGFVGGAVLRALAADSAFSAISGVRRKPAHPHGPAFRLCDALDPASLDRAFAGTDCVVNAVLAGPAETQRATSNICQAAMRAGGPRIIHISSMAVYGAATGLIDESSPLDAGGSRYAAGKIACERLVAAYARSGAGAVILRPGIVYGPGGEQWIGRLCRLLRARRLGDLGAAGDGICNLCFADDLGQAVTVVLRAPADAGEAINLATPVPPRWNEVLTTLALAIGAVPVPRIGARRLALESRALAIPLHLAKRAARSAGLAENVFPEPIPASLLALFAQHIRLDPRRADALGFQRTDDAQGLNLSAAWFLRHERRTP